MTKDGTLLAKRERDLAVITEERDQLRVFLGKLEHNAPFVRRRIQSALKRARHLGDEELVETLETVLKHDLLPDKIKVLD